MWFSSTGYSSSWITEIVLYDDHVIVNSNNVKRKNMAKFHHKNINFSKRNYRKMVNLG